MVTDTPEAKLIAVAEKLLHEASRLRRDVERLAVRIEPFQGERASDDSPVLRFKNMAEALDAMAHARRAIRDAEYDRNLIRGRIDNIASDAISREEMKPWLKR